jgi:hypothetical protein
MKLALPMKYIFFSLIILFSSFVFSYSGPDEPLRVIIETEPVIPFVGLEWKISLFVDHSEVSNVFVQTPPFPDDVVRLDRVRTEPYLMNSGNSEGEMWTLVEYFFVPLKPGQVMLPPFEIKTPMKNSFTSQMVFQIEAHEGTYLYQPELYWESPPQTIQKNQSTELLLVMQNNDPRKNLEDTLLINLDIPKSAIMEKIPLTSYDQERNIILRIKIIPLEEGTLSVNPITVEYDERLLASPSLQIQVIPNTAKNNQGVTRYELSAKELHFDLQGDVTHYDNSDTAFPPPRFFPAPLKKQYDNIIAQTETLWNNGEKVPALSFIRKAERDLTIGFSLRPFRKNLEQKLELGISEDETYLPVHLLLILSAIFFILSIIIFINLFLVRKKHIFHSFFRIVCSILLVICMTTALFCGIISTIDMIKKSGKDAPHQVILYETDAFRVPEISGAINGSFKEGESGVIRSSAGDWLYIETGSGQSGWVQSENVKHY